MSEEDGSRDASASSATLPLSGTEGSEVDKSRSCRGCLLYSSSLREARKNPICIGLGRAEHRVYSVTGEAEREAKRDGQTLADFKYACIGYSIHKEGTAASGIPADEEDLPLCAGLEFLADRRPQPASGGSPPELAAAQDIDDGPPIYPRSPSAMHQPVTIGGISGDEFAGRFVRCAGLVASAVVRNASKMVTSIKTGFDNMVHDRGRPK